MWTGGEEAPWTESQSPPPAPAATPASADGRGKLQGVLRRRGELGPVPPSRLRPELWGAPKRGRKGSPSPSSGAALRAIGCPDGRLERITLNIAGNSRLTPVERVTGEDFWILYRILKKNPYITGLDVRYNLLSDVGAYYAARLLQKQPYLIYLNLMFNDIGPEGGELIAKALHKNKILKHLKMTGNKIENKGGMCFAAMLQINSSLEKLDLGDCDLGMQSVIAFATVLTQNQTIKGINLNRPLLYGEQEESTVHLGHMLKENHCLVELHMCKHQIKTDGIRQLCDALYLNRSLRYLDVSCNKITHDGMVYLADVLKSNTTLEVIDLSFNRIENAGANYLSETLASHNRSLKALVWFYI
uniref:Leucine rich repeat containing 34 n=1 Tax=Equus caballus TaxID=9796 RepID=A0A3Q2HRT1_HORSE